MKDLSIENLGYSRNLDSGMYQYGYPQTITETYDGYYRTDVSAQVGFSGGPSLDKTNYIVGVASKAGVNMTQCWRVNRSVFDLIASLR